MNDGANPSVVAWVAVPQLAVHRFDPPLTDVDGTPVG